MLKRIVIIMSSFQTAMAQKNSINHIVTQQLVANSVHKRKATRLSSVIDFYRVNT